MDRAPRLAGIIEQCRTPLKAKAKKKTQNTKITPLWTHIMPEQKDAIEDCALKLRCAIVFQLKKHLLMFTLAFAGVLDPIGTLNHMLNNIYSYWGLNSPVLVKAQN